jgi:hypothetical protein
MAKHGNLINCSDPAPPELADYREREAPFWVDVPTSDPRLRVALATATVWSHENCYLPCLYQMCGDVRFGKDGSVYVYIRPDGVSRDFQEGKFSIFPEADIELSSNGETIIEARPYHSGCVRPCDK